MSGKIMGKNKGNGDRRYPNCSGPECWCVDCSMDSVYSDDDEEKQIRKL